MFLLTIGIFLAGIAMIALEDKININKSATALLMSITLWIVVSFAGIDINGPDGFIEHLGDVSETLFFVMGALVIIEIIDTHGGFRVITNAITTNNKRRLLWVVSFLTFILSAMLDNIATGVIMVSLLRKFIPHQRERWIFGSMIIIAANAGGSFSPIGDVTTILLWTGGNVTPAHQIGHLILPALVAMIVPLLIVTRFFKKDATLGGMSIMQVENSNLPQVSRKSRIVILVIGVCTMLFVPFFADVTGLPPFMGILGGVTMLWIYTDYMYKKDNEILGEKLQVGQVLSRIDMSTILFFLGILMSVAALNVSGQLAIVSDYMSASISSHELIAFVIGIMSSFVDNVALVAATMGMYPLAESGAYAANSEFWTFLAYCAVNGGSLLIIGSATGVTVMGMEKIGFMYYFKRFSLIAVLGYVAGAGVYLLVSMF